MRTAHTNNISLHTFDVFDTCITRMHAHPRDVFYELGLKLAPGDANEKTRHRYAKRFQRARIRAERIANWRARPVKEHADIFEIYANFHWLMHTGLSAEVLVEAELALETASIFPIDATVSHINALRAQGIRVIFISDMYIPARLLGPILIEKGVMKEEDGLYVSCDIGTSKHTGKLFAHVLQVEKAASSQVIHTGDNYHADIRMAQEHGIQARHFTSAHLNWHELQIAKTEIPRPLGKSWLAAFSRRSQLAMLASQSEQSSHPLDGLIFSTIIPFLLSHVLWVLNDANKRGIRRLYFVARDGEVLYKIAKELNPHGIELCYLYGSRRAWLEASIMPDAMDWKKILITPGQSNSRHDIIARAGFEYDLQESLREQFKLSTAQWHESLDQDRADEFIAELLHDSRWSTALYAGSSVKRDVALAYFRQIGMLDGAPWALVDAGWSLNSQAALKRILDSSGRAVRVQGYYIGLARNHLPEATTGPAFAFASQPGSFISRRRVIAEHCFLPATHPSTKGYFQKNNCITPILGNEIRGEPELAYANRLHKASVISAQLVAKSADLSFALKRFTPDIFDATMNFIRNPNPKDANLMANFTTIADIRHENSFAEPLCRPLNMKDVLATILITISAKFNFNSAAFMWMEGSIALSKPHVRLPLKLMLIADDLLNKIKLKRKKLLRIWQ